MSRSPFADLTPLRTSPAFRRLWFGSSASVIGGQIAAFAVMFYVWELTRNPIWVGIVGLVHAVPTIVLALVGGTLADAMDRRRLVVLTSSGQLLAAAMMTTQAVAGIDSLLLILVLLGVQSGLAALGAPARRTFVATLLPPEQVAAGIALSTIMFQAAMLGGPAVAGLVTAQWGVAACFGIDTISFALSLYGVARLPAMPPAEVTSRAGVRAIGDGLRYVVRRPVIRGAFLSDLNATVLAMPIALFPTINAERFGGSPAILGLFLPAVAIGGLLASTLSRTYTRSDRPGRVMLMAALVWGLALLAFGFADVLWISLLCLAIAGAADTVSVISRSTVITLATTDSHRGRVNAIDHVAGVCGPDLGNFRAGAVGSLFSAGTAVVTGGAMAAIGAIAIGWLIPSIRRFRVAQSDEVRVEQRAEA